ncbi:hypothetical protein BDF21DRAFT_405307, partial [Thamnidium elegans]
MQSFKELKKTLNFIFFTLNPPHLYSLYALLPTQAKRYIHIYIIYSLDHFFFQKIKIKI